MNIRRSDILLIVLGLIWAAIIAIAILTLLGPATSYPHDPCPLFRCVNYLNIEFERFQPDAYRVEVSSPDGEPIHITCPGTKYVTKNAETSGCLVGGVHIADMTAEEITVKVTWEGGSKSETFSPNYQGYEPYEMCQLNCLRSTVTMTLP